MTQHNQTAYPLTPEDSALQSSDVRGTLCGRRGLAAEPAAEGVGVHEVRKSLLAGDDNNGDPLAVPPLELRIVRDVDLLELEWDLRLHPLDDATRALAQVTPRR